MAGDVAWGRERVVALPHADITPHLQPSWNLKLRCKLCLWISLSCMTVRKLSGVSGHHAGLVDDGVGATLFVTGTVDRKACNSKSRTKHVKRQLKCACASILEF